MEFLIVFLAGTAVTLLMYGLPRYSMRKQVAARTVPNIHGDPYRTPAEVPAPEPAPKPIKQPKPKREWKMPNVQLNKITKCFMWFMPVCGSAVSVGALYDAPLLGQGLKWGFSIASILVGIFCFIMVIATADPKG